MNVEQLADIGLRARFVLGYPILIVAGVLLGVIALGRMQTITNGMRRKYRLLATIAFNLSYIGVIGILGILQYGTVLPNPQLVLRPISLAFSLGIVWLAVWLATLTAMLIIEELRLGVQRHKRNQ